MSRNINLFGMMGVGKTTVATLVGDALGRRVVDTDAEIAAWAGDPIPVIFAQHGEAGFRRIESRIVQEAAKYTDLVVALGGGAVLDADNVADLLLTGVLLELRTTPEILVQRLRTEADGRPLLASDDLPGRVREMIDERGSHYADVADATFDAGQTPKAVTRDIIDWALKAGDVLTPSEHEQVMR
jgi:shikimate kinase